MDKGERVMDVSKVMNMVGDMEVIAKFVGNKGWFVGDVFHISIEDLAKTIRHFKITHMAFVSTKVRDAVNKALREVINE